MFDTTSVVCNTKSMTTTAASIEERRAALFAPTSDGALIASLLLLDAIERPSSEQRLVRAWTCDELERRHPEVTSALDAWAESDDTTLSYTEVLIAAVRP